MIQMSFAHQTPSQHETWPNLAFGGCRCRVTLAASLLRQPPRAAVCQQRRRQAVTCQAKKGFGSSSTKSKRSSASRLRDDDPDWIRVAKLSDFPAGGRSTLPVILKDKSAVVLYRVADDEVYCSDANSTAFKFPLVDAKLIDRKDGPAVEVPLDGTVYDLDSGRVLEWCPRNNPVRMLLGALKAKSEPEPLKVYPTRVSKDGTIFTRFAPLA